MPRPFRAGWGADIARRTTHAASPGRIAAGPDRGFHLSPRTSGPGLNGWPGPGRASGTAALSFRELAEHAAVPLMRARHRLPQTLVEAPGTDGRNDDHVAIRRKLERRLGANPDLVQQLLVEDESEAVARSGQLLAHRKLRSYENATWYERKGQAGKDLDAGGGLAQAKAASGTR